MDGRLVPLAGTGETIAPAVFFRPKVTVIDSPLRTASSASENRLLNSPTLIVFTSAQIRVAETIDEVAELWHELHGVYSSTLALWQGLDAAFGKAPRGELFEYCKATIQKLERASAQAYEFHA
jgi:hypothetical protein